MNREVFMSNTAFSGLQKAQLDNVWNLLESAMWSEVEFVESMVKDVPGIGELFRIWRNTLLKGLELTSVGIAIGYAN